MLQNNIKQGCWLQVTYPVKKKNGQRTAANSCFKRNLWNKSYLVYARTGGYYIIWTWLESIKSLEARFLESMKHSFSVLKCQAISNSIFCFLNSFLEPASIPCKFFPWSFAILITTYVILGNFFKEGYLWRQKLTLITL